MKRRKDRCQTYRCQTCGKTKRRADPECWYCKNGRPRYRSAREEVQEAGDLEERIRLYRERAERQEDLFA